MLRKALLLALLAGTTTGCIKSMAINALGNALAEGGGTYARDDDPELVRDATPFGLKTIESLLDAKPEHRGLLLAAARGYTQYAYAFLQSEADYIDEEDFAGAQKLRARAKKLYARAITYGQRGLEVEHEDLFARLRSEPEAALADLEEEDVPLILWTSLAWAAAVGLDKNDAERAADLDLVEALMLRALALRPKYEEGAIHDFFVAWYGGRPEGAGGSTEKAREHLDRSLELSDGTRLGPLVTYADQVLTKQGKPAEFEQMLQRVLAFDVDSAPKYRLANLIAQKRAQWLLDTREDRFLE